MTRTEAMNKATDAIAQAEQSLEAGEVVTYEAGGDNTVVLQTKASMWLDIATAWRRAATELA